MVPLGLSNQVVTKVIIYEKLGGWVSKIQPCLLLDSVTYYKHDLEWILISLILVSSPAK